MQRVTIISTCYHKSYRRFSLSLTRIAHNGTRYHNLNMLPHALPYIFSQSGMAWGLFAAGYQALPSFFFEISVYIFL